MTFHHHEPDAQLVESDDFDDETGRKATGSALPVQGASISASVPESTAYHDGFDLNTAETLRVEVSALRGGPVTLTISMPVASIPLTPGEARRLGMLLARAAIAAHGDGGPRPDTSPGDDQTGR